MQESTSQLTDEEFNKLIAMPNYRKKWVDVLDCQFTETQIWQLLVKFSFSDHAGILKKICHHENFTDAIFRKALDEFYTYGVFGVTGLALFDPSRPLTAEQIQLGLAHHSVSIKYLAYNHPCCTDAAKVAFQLGAR